MTAPAITANQRWTEGRASYKRPDDPIKTHEHEVAELEDKTTACDFVATHHYARRFPPSRLRFGLYRGGELVGAAVFSPPQNNKIITRLAPGLRHLDGVVLSRFVLLDQVAGNGETWFLGRCFEVLRKRGDLRAVVSFSDPEERHTAAGELVKPGHVGTIYQAFNGVYAGRATRRSLKLFPDGTVFDDRTAQKVRAGERGDDGAIALLVSHGARPPRRGEDLSAWLREATHATTRKMRHPGNHRYVWALDRHLRASLDPRPRRPYPKRVPT